MKIKKLLASLMIGASVFALASCNEEKPNDPGTGNEEITPTPEQTKPSIYDLRYILADTTKTKLNYYINEEFTTEGLSVEGSYKGKMYKYNMDEIVVDSSKFNNKRVGKYTIVVKYVEGAFVKTVDYVVTVSSILDTTEHVVGIDLNTDNVKKVYKPGEEFSSTGLTAEAVIYNPTTQQLSRKDITNDEKLKIDSQSFNNQLVGFNEIVVSYGESYTENGKSQDVEVKAFFNVELESTLSDVSSNIETIDYKPYTIGDNKQFDSLDTSTIKIYAKYAKIKEKVELSADEFTYKITNSATSETPVSFTSDPLNAAYLETYFAKFSYTYKGVTKTAIVRIKMEEYKTPLKELSLRTTTLDSEIIADVVVNDTFTIKAIPQGSVASDSCSATCYPSEAASQFTWYKRIKLSGTGSRETRSIAINLAAGQTVTAYVISDNESESAIAGFYDTNGTKIEEYTINGEAVTKISIKATEAGTYYLWGTGAINVFYVAVTA